MSETDGFIEEVAEEVRRDRLFKLFRKWGWIPALLVIIVVGGAAWNEYRKATIETEARKLGDAMLTALSIDDSQARATALTDISTQNAAAPVLEIAKAAALADSGDIIGADALLVAVASDGDIPVVYRDLARLKRLYLEGNGLSGSDRLATIDALSVPGAPFRTLAAEQRGLMQAQDGDIEGALSTFTSLLNDSEATAGVVSRARQMIVVLGGSLGSG